MDRHPDFLTTIEKPSRYLGSEINAVRKDPKGVKLRMALAFPDLYEIGRRTSDFRFFITFSTAGLKLPPKESSRRLWIWKPISGRREAPSFPWNPTTPLQHFDIVGFSLLYELNYTNMLTMLELGGVPWLAAERDSRHPLVIAGGPCTCNPEPVAEFFDAMVVGDGEAVVVELAHAWLAWKQAGARDRQALLKRWSAIQGVYIPAFFEARFDASGFQTVVPIYKDYAAVRRLWWLTWMRLRSRIGR